MTKIIISGNGTDVGKTIVSSIIVTALQGDYWKPIQQADENTSDSKTVRELVPSKTCTIHPSTYNLKAPLSPHHAARLENITIEPSQIVPPHTHRPLIMETAGGIFVPINNTTLIIDVFDKWNAFWIIVSKHYLGSINHTLLTLEALKTRNCPIKFIVFNGAPNPDSEQAILERSGIPCLGRLLPETTISQSTIQRYAQQWSQQLKTL